jgi:hypothetical protein
MLHSPRRIRHTRLCEFGAGDHVVVGLALTDVWQRLQRINLGSPCCQELAVISHEHEPFESGWRARAGAPHELERDFRGKLHVADVPRRCFPGPNVARTPRATAAVILQAGGGDARTQLVALVHAGDPPLVLIERQRGLHRTAIDVVVVRETMRRAAAADSAPRISQPAALQQAPPDVAPVAVQLCLRQVGDVQQPYFVFRRVPIRLRRL